MSRQMTFSLNLTDEFIKAARPVVQDFHGILNDIIQTGNFDKEKMLAASRKVTEDMGLLLENKGASEDEYYALAAIQLILFGGIQPYTDINWRDLRMAILTGEPTNA